jgi:hypothetical protein
MDLRTPTSENSFHQSKRYQTSNQELNGVARRWLRASQGSGFGTVGYVGIPFGFMAYADRRKVIGGARNLLGRLVPFKRRLVENASGRTNRRDLIFRATAGSEADLCGGAITSITGQHGVMLRSIESAFVHHEGVP